MSSNFPSLALNLVSATWSVVRYLQVEWDVKKAEAEGPRTFDKDGIRGANPRVPQQTNYSDCGIYILQYVESFFEVSYSLTDIR